MVLQLGDSSESDSYANALRDVFVGSESGGGTSFGPKELLQAGEFRQRSLTDADLETLASFTFLRDADRVLVVVLDSRAGATPAKGVLDSERAVMTAIPPAVRSRVVLLNVRLKDPRSLHQKSSRARRVVRLGLADLDERDLRLPFLTLYALHHGLRLFAKATPGRRPKAARLFLSHAKRDGVPLTKAFRGFISELKGFGTFYDTVDLDLNGDLTEQLSTAVANAVVIVFRSDVFDQRYWCQKEVIWAEQHGRPVVTVDARWHIEHGPSLISFDSMPVVRIPDGNVVRICMAALMEALRIHLFDERAEAHASASARGVLKYKIPRCPSLVSLDQACRKLLKEKALKRSARKPAYIVYPNPSLPADMSEAADTLTQFAIKGCRVVSLDEFRLLA
jgi:hypothetical protein